MFGVGTSLVAKDGRTHGSIQCVCRIYQWVQQGDDVCVITCVNDHVLVEDDVWRSGVMTCTWEHVLMTTRGGRWHITTCWWQCVVGRSLWWRCLGRKKRKLGNSKNNKFATTKCNFKGVPSKVVEKNTSLILDQAAPCVASIGRAQAALVQRPWPGNKLMQLAK